MNKFNVIISKDIKKFLEKVRFRVKIYVVVVLYASHANFITSTITIMQLQGKEGLKIVIT